MFTIKDKVALITGGCGGLGFAFATELLRKGAKGVTLVDIDEDIGDVKVQELEDDFGANKAIFVMAYVEKPDLLKRAFDETIRNYNQLDIVINNAGILDEIDWRKVIDINLKGTIEGSNLAINTYFPKYRSTHEGVLVNVSSIVGLQTNGTLPVYTSTKFGITGFTRSYGYQMNYNSTKTRVLGLCPGYTRTNIYDTILWKLPFWSLFNLRRVFGDLVMQEPEDVANSMCRMIETAKHGSFWEVVENKTYEVIFSKEEPIKQLIT